MQGELSASAMAQHVDFFSMYLAARASDAPTLDSAVVGKHPA